MVQHCTLTCDDGDHDENGDVICCCLLIHSKWIETIKYDDQKPNETAQTLIPYFSITNTVPSPVTMAITDA